jgi:hypothetical protein
MVDLSDYEILGIYYRTGYKLNHQKSLPKNKPHMFWYSQCIVEKSDQSNITTTY